VRSLALTGALWLSACYTFVPSGASVRGGESVALQINDVGRVALAERLGPELHFVEGTVLSTDSAAVTVRVNAVTTVSGGRAHWSGERVPITQGYIKAVSQRKLSPSRTLLLVAGAAAALVVAMSATGLLGSGREDSIGEVIPPPGEQ
jgi:hypothetical protein